MAAGVAICEVRFIPESILLNWSLVITVWHGSACAKPVVVAEPVFTEPVFTEPPLSGHTPWTTTTAAFGATLSGLNDGCCAEGVTDAPETGGSEGACTGGTL